MQAVDHGDLDYCYSRLNDVLFVETSNGRIATGCESAQKMKCHVFQGATGNTAQDVRYERHQLTP